MQQDKGQFSLAKLALVYAFSGDIGNECSRNPMFTRKKNTFFFPVMKLEWQHLHKTGDSVNDRKN